MIGAASELRVVFFIYVSCLVLLTLTPFNFTESPTAPLAWFESQVDGFDVVLNILGFLPFGILCSYVVRQPVRIAWTTTIVIIGVAAIFSAALEFGQTLLPERSASAFDVAANVVGTALGCLTARFLSRGHPSIDPGWSGSRVLKTGFVGYAVALICLFVWTHYAQGLQSWNPDYPLVIGNEATLTRPWLGKIFVIALYDRALEREEVEQQFRAAHPCDTNRRLYDDPLALYRFQEGNGARVLDLAETENPLDLEIMEPTYAQWLPGCGLALRGPTILKARHVHQKLFRRILAADAFSVVVWVHPANVRQKGPARIVSLSLTSSLRNFTLGQQGGEVHFRVRNAISGENGTRWALTTSDLKWSPDLTHIVATYDHGADQLYVNGAVVAHAAAIDMLELIGRALKLDLPSGWQRIMTIGLLMAPVVSGWLLFSMSRRDGDTYDTTPTTRSYKRL